MKAQSNIYHVRCFTCSVCSTLLQTGDHFGIYDTKIYCRSHFERLQFNMINNLPINASSQYTVISSSPPTSTAYVSSCNGETTPCGIDGISHSLSPTGLNTMTSTTNTLHEEMSFMVDQQYTPSIPSAEYIHLQADAVNVEPTSNTKSRQRKKRQNENTEVGIRDRQWSIGEFREKEISLFSLSLLLSLPFSYISLPLVSPNSCVPLSPLWLSALLPTSLQKVLYCEHEHTVRTLIGLCRYDSARPRAKFPRAAAGKTEANENIIQTPPAAYHETVLQPEPQSRRQRSETAVAED